MKVTAAATGWAGKAAAGMRMTWPAAASAGAKGIAVPEHRPLRCRCKVLSGQSVKVVTGLDGVVNPATRGIRQAGSFAHAAVACRSRQKQHPPSHVAGVGLAAGWVSGFASSLWRLKPQPWFRSGIPTHRWRCEQIPVGRAQLQLVAQA